MKQSFIAIPETIFLSGLCHFTLRVGSSRQAKSFSQVPRFESKMLAGERAGGEGGWERGRGGERGEAGRVELARQVEWVEGGSWIVKIRSL